MELALEHSTASSVACRRGDRLGSTVGKARDREESEEEELCPEEEKEAEVAVGVEAGGDVTFSL